MGTMKSIFATCLFQLATIMLQAQVGIGTSSPAASAKLEVSSTTQGFLPPRVVLVSTTNTSSPISSPATGLLVYNTATAGSGATTVTPGYYYFNGSAWVRFTGGGEHYIGESYGGGKVFYVYDGGKHGLIAATSDQSTGARWNGCCQGADNINFGPTLTTGDGIGAGIKNTAALIASTPKDGYPYAATICNDFSVTVDGVTYGDWYLPSKHELNLLYLQKAAVGGSFGAEYWSSNESTDTYYKKAWSLNFSNSNYTESIKDLLFHVRAIRAF
jgi:hypothetical protein